jgi:hypothetical protein
MRWLLCAACLAVSCEHPLVDRRTASEHRARAEQLTQQAQDERAQFDPTRTQTEMASRTPFSEGPEGITKPYNSTQPNLLSADDAMRQAAAESAAARELERFEDLACKAIPRAERAACPLLASQVEQVRETASGIELTLRESADTDDALRRLKCHLAFARVTGFDHPSCPLFTRGESIEKQGPRRIAFSGDTPQAAQRIQDEAAKVFGTQGATFPTGRP